MIHTIELLVRSEDRVPYEVLFPIYRKHVLEGETVYTRIAEDRSAVHLTLTTDDPGSQGYTVEVEQAYDFGGSEPDFHLGHGIYESAREEFQRALLRCRDAMSGVIIAFFMPGAA